MFDPSDDFVAVTDGAETVTLLRRGSTLGTAGTAIAHALRRAVTAGEAPVVNRGDVRKNVASSGRHVAATVVWHLPIAELPIAPGLGDWILDGDGQRWTILAIKRATLGARWRCETKNVAIAFGLDDTITVLKNVNTVSEPVWRTWKTGVRARIQPNEVKITSDETSASTTKSYRIFVEDDLTLDHTHCIRSADGPVHTITRTLGADRIGELQVIETQVIESTDES